MDILENLYLSEDGIVELIKEVQIYYEECSSDANPKVGELQRKLYKCRLYCDFNGKPVVRNNIRIYSDIEPLKNKYRTIFDKYYKSSNSHFLKTTEKQQTLVRQIFLQYQLTTDIANELTKHFPVIKAELAKDKEFYWSDFVNVTKKYVAEMNCTQFLRYGFVFSDKPDFIMVKIRLDSMNYEVKQRATVFHNVVLFTP